MDSSTPQDERWLHEILQQIDPHPQHNDSATKRHEEIWRSRLTGLINAQQKITQTNYETVRDQLHQLLEESSDWKKKKKLIGKNQKACSKGGYEITLIEDRGSSTLSFDKEGVTSCIQITEESISSMDERNGDTIHWTISENNLTQTTDSLETTNDELTALRVLLNKVV